MNGIRGERWNRRVRRLRRISDGIAGEWRGRIDRFQATVATDRRVELSSCRCRERSVRRRIRIAREMLVRIVVETASSRSATPRFLRRTLCPIGCKRGCQQWQKNFVVPGDGVAVGLRTRRTL